MPRSGWVHWCECGGHGECRLWCLVQRSPWYTARVIRSFRSKETEQLFERQRSRRFGNIGAVARRKLRMLDDAEKLEDMAAVPGNRLESLGGARKGQHSIRINDQWRICFSWRNGAAESVEIVDYH